MNITRQQQILSLIKRIVSEELKELNHERFHAVVVTDVMMSNDGRLCRIWVDADEPVIDLLNTTFHHEIQRRFLKKFARKVVPKLHFLKDQGEVDRMESLLSNLTPPNDHN